MVSDIQAGDGKTVTIFYSVLHLLSKAAGLATSPTVSLCVLARSVELLGLFIALDPQSTHIQGADNKLGQFLRQDI